MVFYFILPILFLAGFFGFGRNVYASSSLIIINEIQTSGGTRETTQEFIELYNATAEDVNLAGFSLKKKTKTQTDMSILISSDDFSGIIPAYGYFLISHPDYTIATADIFYSTLTNGKIPLISDHNTVLLYDNNKTLLDKVGYGDAQDYETFPEASPAPNITDKKSIERINFQDTNNNGADFNLPDTPTPQNSKFKPIEYSNQILINELLPNPTGNFKEEFVEIYNVGDTSENLFNWKLMDNDGYTCKFPAIEIEAGKYLEIKKSSFDNCSIALNNSGDEIGLYNPRDPEPISFVFYDETAESNHSYSFDGEAWQWTSHPTPEAKNEFDEIVPPEDTPDENVPPADENTESDYAVYLNEILPNPKGDEKTGEFVEIYNAGETDANLSDWTLKDASKTKYIFPSGVKIEPGKYLIVYRTDFKFAMNNSGQETISLLDKGGKVVSAVSYSGAKENTSYNFDGAFWHWSRFLTPKKENRFNHAPKVKIKKIKEAFAGVPVAFEASVKDKDKDKVKYIWDFGDKHKSYLKNPTHIFEKKKNYNIILTVDDGSEKFAKTLSVKVKNYPKADVKIVQLSPNPAGNDTGKEKISLLNNSKKKINLRGWKIATGSKKLINHIITKDFLIEPGKTASVTRQNAFFYLNNTAMKLELRYPNGKTADKVAYQKEKIDENEIYKKINGQWAWIAPPAENKLALAENPAENNPAAIEYTDTEIQDNLGKYSESASWRTKKENKIILASYGTQLSLPDNFDAQPRVLGVSTVRDNSKYFAFGQPYTPEPHWAIKIWANILTAINSLINGLFLQF